MEHYVYPPRAYQISKHANGTLPEQQGLFTIDNPQVQLSCLKKAQDTDGMIVRVYNPNSNTEKCTLSFAAAIKDAWTVTLNETKEGPIAVTDNSQISLEIGPYKLQTLLITT
jgi:alpha-mannosidase